MTASQYAVATSSSEFVAILKDVQKQIENCPAPYSMEDVVDPPIVLHYFIGGCDWWLYELDKEELLAFGFVNLNDPTCAELGYVSIEELVSIPGMQLDFHWTPTPLSVIKKQVYK